MFDYIDFRPKKKSGYHSNVSPCTIYPQNISCVAKIDKHNEHAIYQFMQSIPLGTVAPKYYGLYEAPGYLGLDKKEREKRMEIDGNYNYIIMEDLMHGFKKPNCVDIKLGTRSSDIRTKQRSIERLAYLVASTTSSDFGFRVTDIVCNKLLKDQTKKPNRKEMASNIYETNNFFKNFFSTQHLKTLFDELKRIRSIIILTLHQFPGFRIYASSVFIAYDGEAPDDSEIRIKLIDFAHVHFDVSKDGGDPYSRLFDDGVLRGLDSMISMIGVILCERKVPIGNDNLVDPEIKYIELEKKKNVLKEINKAGLKNKDKEKGKDKSSDKKSDKKKAKAKSKESQKKDKETTKEKGEVHHKEEDPKSPISKESENNIEQKEKESKVNETTEKVDNDQNNTEKVDDDQNNTEKIEDKNENNIEKDEKETTEKTDIEHKVHPMSESEKEEEEESAEFENYHISESDKEISDPENDGKIESESANKCEEADEENHNEKQEKA